MQRANYIKNTEHYAKKGKLTKTDLNEIYTIVGNELHYCWDKKWSLTCFKAESLAKNLSNFLEAEFHDAVAHFYI